MGPAGTGAGPTSGRWESSTGALLAGALLDCADATEDIGPPKQSAAVTDAITTAVRIVLRRPFPIL
jgi:hypothetical protein